MERVVTINLNGNPYQLEEPAYDALRGYLERARSALAENPDQAEIVRDLEQAIADKCAGYLSSSKTVVTATEMARILGEMGPVEGDGDQQQSSSASGDNYVRPQRRLYRIYDNGAWTGVSAGLAAYAGIDVAWVRAVWIITAIFSGGFTALFYAVLIFAMPVASTSEELAAAHGAPFNAQEVVDRAKREYARFTDENAPRWRAAFREHRREWRNRAKRGAFFHVRAGVRPDSWDSGPGPVAASAQPAGYATRVFAGLGAFIFSIISAALLIAFLIAFFSVLTTGMIVGWAPPIGVPLWLVLVILAIVYAAISAPFRALRHASFATVSGERNHRGDSLITLVLVAAALWFAWMYWPDARDLMEQAYVAIRDFSTYLTREFGTN